MESIRTNEENNRRNKTMKQIKGDYIMEKDEIIDDDLYVEGNIYGKDGNRYNLNCKDINCRDIYCNDINCKDINCRDIYCRDINCRDINCYDINCNDINCQDLSYYAVAFAYKNILCNSIQGRRQNSRYFVLDGQIIEKGETKQ